MGLTKLADSPLSIGYYSPGWPLDAFPNGVVSYVTDLYFCLKALGHEVTVVAPSVIQGEQDGSVYQVEGMVKSRSPLERTLNWMGCRIAPERMYQRTFKRPLLATVNRVISERGIQLFEMEEAFGWARWIRNVTSIPICVRLHGPWFLALTEYGAPDSSANRHRIVEEGRSVAEADAVTAPSHDILERTRAYYSLALEEAEVIPPPAPTVQLAAKWRLEDCDPNLVLFIGRFDRHKGGDLIIEAFRHVLLEMPEAKLCFIGPDLGFRTDDGKIRVFHDFVRDRLPGALESGVVTYHGHQPYSALNQFRRKALVNVVCSRYETVSRVLIESMALGCPFVAARAGGMPEVFDENIDGLSHRPNDPADLATKIISLMKEPTRAAQLGRQAALTCERRYHTDVIVARILDFYRRLIAQAKPRRATSAARLRS